MVSGSPGRKPRARLSRAQSAKQTREALIDAALRVFMRFGYGKTSVARITQEAGVSQGNFYSYFSSHTELLSMLLPIEGERIQAALGEAPKSGGFFRKERQRFQLILRYVRERPYILRLLVESEAGDPEGFRQYMLEVEQRYLDACAIAQAAGEVRNLSEDEVRVIAEMVAGCRAQIALHLETLSHAGTKLRARHERWSVDALEKFLANGLGAEAAPVVKFSEVKGRRGPPLSLKESIFEAAAVEIGEVGFAATTVQAILARANIALGTFYAYFGSREQFFVGLLRYSRRLIAARVREAVAGSTDVVDIEARGLYAFFEALVDKPWLASLPAEAAVWAPDSYRLHFGVISRSYRWRLRAIARQGQLEAYSTDELVVLGAIFTSARHYLASRFLRREDAEAPKWVVKIYAEIVAVGLSPK